MSAVSFTPGFGASGSEPCPAFKPLQSQLPWHSFLVLSHLRAWAVVTQLHPHGLPRSCLYSRGQVRWAAGRGDTCGGATVELSAGEGMLAGSVVGRISAGSWGQACLVHYGGAALPYWGGMVAVEQAGSPGREWGLDRLGRNVGRSLG